ncbi:TIGR01620 family protein [Pseudoalteromonas ruthenica]|uniref:TIGR01620 family protein n=1 Tax=Pseudoalteromonas ruthenica TaxID=151081 RepID=UPI000349C5DE|nr:TIGR01620 family protein [Pseudoalteromonas ruthenica]
MSEPVNLAGARRFEGQSQQQSASQLEPAKVVARNDAPQEEDDFDLAQGSELESTLDEELGRQRGKRSLLKRLFAWLLLTLIIVETVLSIVASFQASVWLGALYSSVIGLAVLLIGRLLWRELVNLKRLKVNRHHQQQAQRLLASEQIGQALPWLESVNRIQNHADFAQFKGQIAEHLSDREVMELYRDTLLVRQDEQAKKIINRYAVESAVLVSVSPLAVVDMLAVLWRGLKLVDTLADNYGLALGYMSRVRLYRSLVKQMLFVGSTELLADLAATAFGTKLLSVLSTRAAQGLSAGVLTARIGYKAMELCRPLPKLEAKPSLLRATAKRLAARLTRLDKRENEQTTENVNKD